tara:strand:- start:1708 stop:2406 length:699 start_codon:yes stop_codon:yes gene_type:complete
MKKIILFKIFFSSLLHSFSYAEMNNDAISKMIGNYLKKNNVNKAFFINKKLKLPSCNGEIKIENRFKDFKTLKISCLSKQNWSFNIRTNLKSKYKGSKTVRKKNKEKFLAVLTKNGVKKGDIFKKDDIILKSITRTGSLDYFNDVDLILGKEAKVSVRSNQIIRTRHLVKNWTIKEGQKVIIENNKSNIQILVEGIATKSAMKGEYLDVLNKSSGDIIKAWVKNSKKVTVFR